MLYIPDFIIDICAIYLLNFTSKQRAEINSIFPFELFYFRQTIALKNFRESAY